MQANLLSEVLYFSFLQQKFGTLNPSGFPLTDYNGIGLEPKKLH